MDRLLDCYTRPHKSSGSSVVPIFPVSSENKAKINQLQPLTNISIEENNSAGNHLYNNRENHDSRSKNKFRKKSAPYDSKSKNLAETKSDSESTSDSSQNQRRKFTAEEDLKLKKIISKYGAKKWDQIALLMPGRTGRQCRDRFHNYLNPSLQNGPWSKEEDILLEQKVYELGQHWNKIVKFFVGRSENNIKNRWYTYVSKHKQGKIATFPSQKIYKNCYNYEHKIEKGNVCRNYANNFIVDQYNNNFYYYNGGNNFSNIGINNICVSNNNNSAMNPLENNLNVINQNRNIDILTPKSEKEKKVFFPPIFPPNDSIIWSLDQGMFDFLNKESVA